MKRYGNLFERVVDFDNLISAAKKTLRGHRNTIAASRFYFHLETEIFRLVSTELCQWSAVYGQRLCATGYVPVVHPAPSRDSDKKQKPAAFGRRVAL